MEFTFHVVFALIIEYLHKMEIKLSMTEHDLFFTWRSIYLDFCLESLTLPTPWYGWSDFTSSLTAF